MIGRAVIEIMRDARRTGILPSWECASVSEGTAAGGVRCIHVAGAFGVVIFFAALLTLVGLLIEGVVRLLRWRVS